MNYNYIVDVLTPFVKEKHIARMIAESTAQLESRDRMNRCIREMKGLYEYSIYDYEGALLKKLGNGLYKYTTYIDIRTEDIGDFNGLHLRVILFDFETCFYSKNIDIVDIDGGIYRDDHISLLAGLNEIVFNGGYNSA